MFNLNFLLAPQSRCRGFLARKAFQFHVGDHQAVAIIQRNVRIFLQLRDWKWWKLYTKLKPNLKTLADLNESKGIKSQLIDLGVKLEAAEKDKQGLQDKVDELSVELASVKEALDLEQETGAAWVFFLYFFYFFIVFVFKFSFLSVLFV
jgi:myosin heavy subunit